MRRYRLPSDSQPDNNLVKDSKKGKYSFREYDGEKIRHPEYKFQEPEKEKIIDVLSEDIEGKWKGSPMIRVAEYADQTVSPYNPDIDYLHEYKLINFNMFDHEDVVTPLILRKYEWFNNNRITAFEELVQYVFNIDITKIDTNRYSLRVKSLFKKFTVENFFSEHVRNHKVLDYFFGVNYNKDRRKLITDYLEGTETTIYDSNDMDNYLEKKGDFYILEHNSPEPDEIVGDAGANCKLAYDESRYTFVFQQIANSQLVLHGCWFTECVMNWNELVKEKNMNGTRQYRTVLQRQRVEPKTHISVGGDYVEKKVDIRDSVINRSDI
tara:strand:+ start:1621 stop:2592 length:972 start_codon:yes stop_codon:yes gene_type:complete